MYSHFILLSNAHDFPTVILHVETIFFPQVVFSFNQEVPQADAISNTETTTPVERSPRPPGIPFRPMSKASLVHSPTITKIKPITVEVLTSALNLTQVMHFKFFKDKFVFFFLVGIQITLSAWE